MIPSNKEVSHNQVVLNKLIDKNRDEEIFLDNKNSNFED